MRGSRGWTVEMPEPKQRQRQQVEHAWARWTSRPRRQGWGQVILDMTVAGILVPLGLLFAFTLEHRPGPLLVTCMTAVLFATLFLGDLRTGFPAANRRGGRPQPQASSPGRQVLATAAAFLVPAAAALAVTLLVPDSWRAPSLEFLSPLAQTLSFIAVLGAFGLAGALLLHALALGIHLVRHPPEAGPPG
jgi:hypothetical protein